MKIYQPFLKLSSSVEMYVLLLLCNIIVLVKCVLATVLFLAFFVQAGQCKCSTTLIQQQLFVVSKIHADSDILFQVVCCVFFSNFQNIYS